MLTAPLGSTILFNRLVLRRPHRLPTQKVARILCAIRKPPEKPPLRSGTSG